MWRLRQRCQGSFIDFRYIQRTYETLSHLWFEKNVKTNVYTLTADVMFVGHTPGMTFPVVWRPFMTSDYSNFTKNIIKNTVIGFNDYE